MNIVLMILGVVVFGVGAVGQVMSTQLEKHTENVTSSAYDQDGVLLAEWVDRSKPAEYKIVKKEVK